MLPHRQIREPRQAQADARVREPGAWTHAQRLRLGETQVGDAEDVIADARREAFHGTEHPRLVGRVELRKTERRVHDNGHAGQPRAEAAEKTRLGRKGVDDIEALVADQPIRGRQGGKVAIRAEPVRERNDSGAEPISLQLRKRGGANQGFVRSRQRDQVTLRLEKPGQGGHKRGERLGIGRDEQDADRHRPTGRAQNFHGFNPEAAGL